MNENVTLAMGGGGKETNELIDSIFKKHFSNPSLTADDAAVLDAPAGKIAMTTDGFIVSPARFPGGDIGKLSICGTVNDLACMGAVPLYLSCAFVIEEGFPIQTLDEIARSMRATADEAGISVVAGDTKVAGKGQVDGVFITTTGIGRVIDGVNVSGSRAQVGDVVIVTGDIGRHGAAILLSRGQFDISAENLTSDCVPLSKMTQALFAKTKNVHVLRDATRGGVGTVLYEIAAQSGVGIEIDGAAVPVSGEVKGLCGMLGLEPLYLACEGRMVLFAPRSESAAILDVLRSFPCSREADEIGKVVGSHVGKIVVNTEIGAQTMLPAPGGELLPRIC